MLNRRVFLVGAGGALALTNALSRALSGTLTPQSPVQGPSPEQWMSEWMQSTDPSRKPTRGSEGTLVLGRFADPIYYLMAPISWKPGHEHPGYPAFTVPAGFVTDLASIPQVFWSLLRPDGDYAYAAILHDYLYWEQSTFRRQADDILNFCMEEFSVNPSTRATIFQAVREFGGRGWDGNAQLKAAGESRFLKQFPTDPKVRWPDWKSSKQHFLPNPP